MPKITLMEGQNILNQLEERIDHYRRLVNRILDSQTVDKVVITEPVNTTGGKEVTKDIEPNPQFPKMTLDEVHTKMEELYVERNRVQVAMRKFESTETFAY